MKSIAWGLAFLPLVAAFHIPLPGGNTMEVRRQSVVDLKGFKNHTSSPQGITLARYGPTLDPHKPTAVFIPGLEFSCLSLAQYAKQMEKDFNLLYACSDNMQTQDLETMVSTLDRFIRENNLHNVTVVGESSGGIMALALGLKGSVQDVVLINSATAYPNSRMQQAIDTGRRVSEYEYRLGVLLFMTTQKVDIASITSDTDRLYLMTAMLMNLFYFPKDVLIKRIDEWIMKGIVSVEKKLHDYPVPVLLVASKNDEMFSSFDEADRLKLILPDATIIHVPSSGHLTTPDKLPLCSVIKRFLRRQH